MWEELIVGAFELFAGGNSSNKREGQWHNESDKQYIDRVNQMRKLDDAEKYMQSRNQNKKGWLW